MEETMATLKVATVDFHEARELMRKLIARLSRMRKVL
jgi:hypothetical protein